MEARPVGRRFLRHPSGPEFDPPRGRISGLRVKKTPRLSHAKVLVYGHPVSRGCGAAIYGWGLGLRIFSICVRRSSS